MGSVKPALSNKRKTDRMKITTFPVTKNYHLEADEDVSVTVRQAREGENAEREEMFSTTTRVFESPELGAIAFDGTVKLQQKQNPAKIRRKEAYLTLGKVVGITDENEVELFRSADSVDGPAVKAAMSEGEFNRVWNRLPPAVAKEICGFVWDCNPNWDPDRVGE